MIEIIFIFLALLFFRAIVINTGVKRLLWFLFGILFFSSNIFLAKSPINLTFTRFLIYVFLLSLLIRKRSFFYSMRSFPLKKILFALLVSHLLIGVFDDRLSLFFRIYRPISVYVDTFFIVFLAYVSIIQKSDWDKIVELMIYCSWILCVYGIFVFITRTNPYDEIISNVYGGDSFFVSEIVDDDQRFRVNSFFFHPITYGYVTGVLFLSIFSRYKTLKGKQLLIFPLLLINLFLSNSRTPMLTFFLGIFIYSLIVFDLRNKFKNIFLGIIIGLVLYQSVPFFQEKMDSALDVITSGGGKTPGSSMEMREMQYAASFVIFSQNPIFGNGFYYINENLGWGDENHEKSDKLQGFESYIFKLIIEEGLFQIVIVLLFFLFLLRYFFINRKISPVYAGLGLSFVCMFLIFSLGTGTLGSWAISMSFIGVMLKLVQLEKIKYRNGR